MAIGKIDFKKPRQKEWGIIRGSSLAQLSYGNVFDNNGNIIKNYSSNCYEDVLEQAHILLASGTGVDNIQIVEFVPYNFVMTPRV